jgi:O-succinylbenzoic acid--CoA ligase
LRTGDIGYLDDDGYLYVLDRRDDLIVTGGENVYPAEVESVLKLHPYVEDAGVVGIADAEWGQRVAAVVVANGALDVDDVIRFCRTRLAGYKVPRYVGVIDSLPRTASGKLRRAELRDRLHQ